MASLGASVVIGARRREPLDRTAEDAFLLGPAAAYITGATVKIDGGAQFQKGRFISVGDHRRSKPFDAFHLRPDFSGTPFDEL